ncbi:hypothetical protein ACJBU6_09156 [Exserohilum turcicum]
MAEQKNTYLEALLMLSNNERFSDARRSLPQSMGDEALEKLVADIIHREFTRRGLEDVASTLLDAIARDGETASEDGGGALDTRQKSSSGTQTRLKRDCLRPLDPPEVSVTRKRTAEAASDTAGQKRVKYTLRSHTAKEVKPSLRIQTPQLIQGKLAPAIGVVYWNPVQHRFSPLAFDDERGDSLATRMTKKFDADYLSTYNHVYEWGKLLRLQEKGVASQCCANKTIINRSKYPGTREMGDMTTACDACIRQKQLCARLVKVEMVNKFAFFPLPSALRVGRQLQEIEFWVQK